MPFPIQPIFFQKYYIKKTTESIIFFLILLKGIKWLLKVFERTVWKSLKSQIRKHMKKSIQKIGASMQNSGKGDTQVILWASPSGYNN